MNIATILLAKMITSYKKLTLSVQAKTIKFAIHFGTPTVI